ncbi:MAG: ATP-binding cassette domain-containing protein [Hyphomicrobium sp.]|nr:ATP-binding cassette domain-containing protein [Hyphomicrobium sp.]
MLRVERLQVAGLPPLSFEVPDGECLAIEGASGAGKTLLLRALADLDPAPGDVVLDGEERGEMPADQWRRRVRYCAAEPAWWSDTPRGCLPKALPERLARLVQSLDLDAALLDRPVSRLSTGERQRLALVRALIDEPRVLLLDEPTGALDAQSAALVEELIRFQMLSGRCVVLVSHDRAQLDRLAHARLLLSRSQPKQATQVACTP